ncbi:MAG: class I SAM-dependent methyltransferase [Planctomycetota bacterium]|nr:class I SAM-dependent methyltransferase [Planctomycetota bacterium]
MSQPLPAPGDRFRFTCLGHRSHGLCSPLSAPKLERLLAQLRLQRGEVMLDLAGGKGLLARAVVERTGARAVVVDANPHFLAEGRAALTDPRASRGLAADLDELVFTHPRSRKSSHPSHPSHQGTAAPADLIDYVQGDVAELAAAGRLPTPAALVACVGARPWADRRTTLAALCDLTAPGGQVLVGEGYYRAAPDAEFMAFLGEEDPAEFEVAFDDHPRLAAELGLELRWSHAASLQEFADYDGRFCEALESWCLAHPSDPDAPAFLERIRAWSGVMTRHGREVMGFGWYLYQRA